MGTSKRLMEPQEFMVETLRDFFDYKSVTTVSGRVQADCKYIFIGCICHFKLMLLLNSPALISIYCIWSLLIFKHLTVVAF